MSESCDSRARKRVETNVGLNPEPAAAAVPLAASTPSSSNIPLMLHACCGPCSIEPVKLLRAEGFEPTIVWSNPNIQPVAEHDRRLETLCAWARDVAHVEVVVAGCDRDAWERACAPAGFDRERRCRACYALRLDEACRTAAELGFTYVSTTLVVSPYQLFDVCGEVLAAAAARYGLTPVWRDFRPYYPEATRESRELGMYRQNYCGCRFSAAEAQMERHEARDERKRAKAEAREVAAREASQQ